MNISIAENCDNDPKKQFIKDYNIAFASCDLDAIASMMSDDAVWNLIGAETITGQDAIRAALGNMNIAMADELVVDNIMVEGNRCASNGHMQYPGGTKLAFSDFYVFAEDELKIKQLTSYGVEL